MVKTFEEVGADWIDPDTLQGDIDSYRIRGYNAPETAKVITDKKGRLRFLAGQEGGKETQEAVESIAEEIGADLIDDSAEKEDDYGRKVVDVKNKYGQDLTNTLYRAGVSDVDIFTDEEGIEAARYGDVEKEIHGRKIHDDILNDKLFAIKEKPVTFKELATNEREYADAVLQVVAAQNGLDLSNEKDFRMASNMVYDAKYDPRSVPFAGVDLKRSDRTKEGVAHSQFGTSWNTGWQGMATGLAGFAELVGVQLGSETIRNWGALKVENAKRDLLDAPILRNLDYRDIDSVWDAWGFMTNNVAMSAPYLITLAGGSLLAPFTGGASAVVAYGSVGATYAGQVWNDITGPKGRREASGSLLAGTGMATLDRLGMAAIFKPSDMLTRAGRQKVIEHLANTNRISETAAAGILNKASKDAIKETIEGMGNFAADNLNNSSIMKDILKRTGRGSIGEGVTEALQEGTGYLASTGLSDSQGFDLTEGWKQHFNPNEFQNLLAASAIAGGTLGGGFSAAGGIINAGDLYAEKIGLKDANKDRLNEYDKLSQDIGSQGSIDDILKELVKETKDQTAVKGKQVKFWWNRGKMQREYHQNPDTGDWEQDTIWQRIKRLPQFAGELVFAPMQTAFSPEVLRRSKWARMGYAIAGQPRGRLYAGRDVQGAEAKYRADLMETINPARLFKRFGMYNNVSNSAKISDMVKRYMAILDGKPVDANGNKPELTANDVNQDKELLNNLEAVKATIYELIVFQEKTKRMRNETHKLQGKNRQDLIDVNNDNWFRESQSWDWKKVRQYRSEWFTFMRKHTKYTEKQLNEIYNKVSNNEDSSDFSIVEGLEWKVGEHKGVKDIHKKDGFEKFANTNIIQNMVNSANQTAKYTAYTQYFGAGGKHLTRIIKGMRDDGLTDEEVGHIVYFMKNVIDAGTGNYKPIKSRVLSRLNNTGAFYASTIGLPLSAISSFPEFAMMTYQARNSQEFNKGLMTGVEQVKEIWKNFLTKGKTLDLNVPEANIDRPSQERLRMGGMFNDDASVATRLGMGETDVAKAWWQRMFFKITLIAGVTNLQRSQAAGAATGFVSDRIKILSAIPEDGKMNNMQQDLYVQLNNLGLDVDKMIELYRKYNDPTRGVDGKTIFDLLMENNPATQDDFKIIEDNMNTAMWYFVNDRVQNPQAWNRPLFYQDPHLQLLVQFNGFISTFTSNIVPRMWNDYVRKGNPRMKYNTFATMVTMLALAGGSQWLKDFIKFGGSTPYLNNAQLLQRALQSSGILGSGERLLQGALPLYQSRDSGITDRLWGETIGSSPMMRNLIVAGKAIKALGQGETERAAKHGAKLIPGVGPITPIRNIISDGLHFKKPNPYPNKGDSNYG